MNSKILIVDDEESVRFTFESFLKDEGYEVVTADSLEKGLEDLDESVDLIFLDILLGRENGLTLLREVKERGLLCPVVMITGSPDVLTAAESVRYGAYDYICKPIFQETLLRVAGKALEHGKVLNEKETFRMRLEGLFRCAKEGIMITDRSLHIVEINESAMSMFECDESVVGLHLDELGNNGTSQVAKFSDMIKSRFEGEIYQLQSSETSKNMGVSASPLTNEEGVDYGYVLIVRN
jgi:DNA-binding NtrC family response regulator